jgi:peptide deformylase
MNVVVPDEYKFLYELSPERPVVKVPDPVLRKVSEPVEKLNKKVGFLIDDLMRVMKKANGVGIAAPQLGQLLRVVVVAPAGYKPMALINPVITKMEGEQIGQEGCLSIPGLYGDVKRAQYIEVEALDRKGNEVVLELEGMPARIVQHEVDHLDGILFIDKVDVSTLHWMNPEEPEE